MIRRTVTGLLGVALVLAGSLLVVPVPVAGAHGDAGTLGIEATAPGPLRVRVRTLLRYAGDGHTVPGAVVTVSATGPDDRTAGPLVLADTGDGTYSGELTVTVPGTWTVSAASVGPAATARTDVVVGPASTTAPTTVRGRTPAPATTPDDPADRTGSDPLEPVVRYVVVVLGVAIITATLVVGLRRRR